MNEQKNTSKHWHHVFKQREKKKYIYFYVINILHFFAAPSLSSLQYCSCLNNEECVIHNRRQSNDWSNPLPIITVHIHSKWKKMAPSKHDPNRNAPKTIWFFFHFVKYAVLISNVTLNCVFKRSVYNIFYSIWHLSRNMWNEIRGITTTTATQPC